MTAVTVERARLRRTWGVVAGVFLVALVASAAGIASVAGERVALAWSVGAAGLAGFELWFLYRHLDANHADGAESGVHDSLGAPNAVTLLRGGAFAAVGGFALVDPTEPLVWAPAVLYGTGCALDWVDGFAAQATGRTTLLGAKLDMAFDTLGFLVAPVVGVLWGRLPVWYLSLSLARYLFKAGRGLRQRRGLAVYDLPPSKVRRPLAGLQMAFIAVALAPVFSPGVVRVAAAVVLAPSLAVFARDYLVVAGHLGRKDNG